MSVVDVRGELTDIRAWKSGQGILDRCEICADFEPPISPLQRDSMALHRAAHQLWATLAAALTPAIATLTKAMEKFSKTPTRRTNER